MKSIKSFLHFIIGAIIFCSCDDIIEPDITSKQVEIKSPADGITIQTITPTFTWNAVDGATKYNIQIAYPSFDKVQVLYDTTITKTVYSKQLNSGIFEWKVRAVNNNYYGAFTEKRKLTIDSSLKIQNQVITLISPTANSGAIDSNFTQTLRWNSLGTIASSYNIKITTPEGSTPVVYGLTDSKYTTKFTKEGAYSWSVQGVDSDGLTNKYCEAASFYIDRTKPIVSTTPASQDTLLTTSDSLSITWTSSDDKLLKGDSIYIYATDSTKLSTSYLPQYFTTPSKLTYTVKKPTAGTYWIKLVSIDAAGNRARTKKRKFVVAQ